MECPDCGLTMRKLPFLRLVPVRCEIYVCTCGNKEYVELKETTNGRENPETTDSVSTPGDVRG